MNLKEMARLMGIGIRAPPGAHSVKLLRPKKLTDRQWGQLLGNAVPIPMLQRVLLRADRSFRNH